MKVNNLTRLTITLSTLCLASALFCSANAHTALKKGCEYASITHPIGAEMTMVGKPMVCTFAVFPNGKVGYQWVSAHSPTNKVALTKPLKVNGTYLPTGAHVGAALDADNNVDTYLHNMDAKFKAVHDADNALGMEMQTSSANHVRLLKNIMQNSPLYEFNLGVQTVSPKLSHVLNSTLAFYQRQRTNILLAELVAQQKHCSHREHLVNQLQAYLHQAVRQLVMAGQQAATVHDDATLLRHGLPNATFTQIKYWDPSVTIKRDGRSIHINPLDHTQFNQEVLFFNGDNDWQVAFARMLVKRSQLPVVLVATQGNIKQLVHTLDAPVYFAHQKTIARLGIHAVPTVVTRGLGYNANRLVFKTVKLPYHFLNQKVYEFTNTAFHSNDAALTAANHAVANQHNPIGKTPVTASLLTRLREAKAQWLLHPTVKSAGVYLKMRHSIEEADAAIKNGIQKTEAYISQHNMQSNDAVLAVRKAWKKETLVSTSAGNGGINVLHGGFNFISEKQIEKFAKDVLAQTSSVSPTKINSNVNHDAALAVRKVWKKTGSVSTSAYGGGIDMTMDFAKNLKAAAKAMHDEATGFGKAFAAPGYSNNATSPEVYKGQAAEYYADSKPIHELDIHAPSYSAGNGGIDVYAPQNKAGKTA